MRILIVNTYSDRPENALFLGLVEHGFDVHSICAPDAPERHELVRGGVRVTELAVKHRLDFHAVRVLRRIIRAERPDLVYAPRNSTLSVSILASIGIKQHAVVAYRGTIGHIDRIDPAAWLTYLNPRVDQILCVSEAVRQYLIGVRLPPARLTTVYKGHDVSWYADPVPLDRADYNIPSNATLVGFIGSIRPVKGVDILVEALAKLPPTTDVHLALIGEERLKQIREQAESLGLRDRVHFLGYRSDAAHLASAFDIFVMPSLEREGLPRAVIEAMAQAVAVIVTQVGGLPELVEDGVSGLVIPPRDPDALAAALQRLAADSSYRETLGAAARQRIQSHFNITATIDNTIAAFRNAIADRKVQS
ncbi:MAG: glycosyltransferase [Verrucomicrobia bacterium]|nr:glycosyltransferase [Verrucomicrobiota bacterium]